MDVGQRIDSGPDVQSYQSAVFTEQNVGTASETVERNGVSISLSVTVTIIDNSIRTQPADLLIHNFYQAECQYSGMPKSERPKSKQCRKPNKIVFGF